MTTGENFAFSYTGTAQNLYRQLLQFLKVLPITDEVAIGKTFKT